MILFPGFEVRWFEVGDVVIHGVVGGSGPPPLLLHGYPQTHTMWNKVAARLAEHFTVVATDLRGYGGSSKPEGLPDHSNYSKRVMAEDQARVMHSLGFDRFRVADRSVGGARYRTDPNDVSPNRSGVRRGLLSLVLFDSTGAVH